MLIQHTEPAGNKPHQVPLRAYPGAADHQPLPDRQLAPDAQIDSALFFTIDGRTIKLRLTEKGIDLILSGRRHAAVHHADISIAIASIRRKHTRLAIDEKLHQKRLMRHYQEGGLHTVRQLLKENTLPCLGRPILSLTDDGKVGIVDEQTGRVMEGHRLDAPDR
jgi:preprotein translocase subunit SecA